MIKILNKISVEGLYLKTIKAIYDKSTANVVLNGEKLKVIPLRSETKRGCPLSLLLFNIVLEILAISNQLRKRKGIQIGREVVKLLLYAGGIIPYTENPKDYTQTPRTDK